MVAPDLDRNESLGRFLSPGDGMNSPGYGRGLQEQARVPDPPPSGRFFPPDAPCSISRRRSCSATLEESRAAGIVRCLVQTAFQVRGTGRACCRNRAGEGFGVDPGSRFTGGNLAAASPGGNLVPSMLAIVFRPRMASAEVAGFAQAGSRSAGH